MQRSLPRVMSVRAPTAPLPKVVSEARCWAITRTISLGVLGAALTYAVLRYVVFGDVAPDNIPLFIMNKAVAVSGAVLLGACLSLSPLMRLAPRLRPWGRLRKHLGLAGFGLSALHVALTMLLLQPAYYAKLYAADGRFALQGELALLFGVGAMFALLFPAVTSLAPIRRDLAPRTWRSLQRLSILAFALTGAHLFALGLPSWLAPATWIGGLPPITLLAALAVVATFTLRIAAARRSNRGP